MLISKKWFVKGNFAVCDHDQVDEWEDGLLTYGGCGCCGGGPLGAITHEPEARLMAAAPEMLALLRDIAKYGPDSVDTEELLERLKDLTFKEE